MEGVRTAELSGGTRPDPFAVLTRFSARSGTVERLVGVSFRTTCWDAVVRLKAVEGLFRLLEQFARPAVALGVRLPAGHEKGDADENKQAARQIRR